jgi:putative FmdB family regulatory protein
MPIYGYVCTQCGHTFEVLQSITDAPMRECPVCVGPLRKQLYPVGVIYKGSGFYSTDYKGGGASKSDSKSESDGTAKASETKPSGDAGGGEKPADKAAS